MSVAARLSRAAGLAHPTALERLTGGRNNRVHRVTLADGSDVALKSYHSDPRDGRDRLAAEWAFLEYARTLGLRNVPVPLAREQSSHAALYSYVRGRKLAARELAADHVDAALDFVLLLNKSPAGSSGLAAAAEACFTLAQHIATVDLRIERIRRMDGTAPFHDDAQRFVTGALVPAWTAVRDRIVRAAHELGLSTDARLPAGETCISPSDFGFHNALLGDDSKLTFLDFEYAGIDDPAKLVCDFFCQPEIRVPITHFDWIVEKLATSLALGNALAARCRLLLDAYRIKWMCIMLNDFQPEGAARRRFAESEARAERCAKQLEKAVAGLAFVEFGHAGDRRKTRII